MEITVKEVKLLSEGESKKGKWKLFKVTTEDGTEYTTFDMKASHLNLGAVVEIGDITIKNGDKRSFKELSVVSEGTATSTSTPSPTNGYPDMSKDDWAEKQRIERESFEAQTAVRTILTLAEALSASSIPDKPILQWQGDDTTFSSVLQKALKWCEAKIDANMNKVTNGFIYDDGVEKPRPIGSFETPQFANVGEFLAACNNAGVPRNKVMEKLGVDEKSLPRINIAESWDIIYEEIIKPSKELME